MADAVDLAQEHELAFRERALADRATVPTPGNGSSVCVRCHDDIPHRLAAMGYRVCVECQSVIERKARA